MSAVLHRAVAWRPAAAATPFCAWRRQDLDRLACVLTAALAQWSQDWDLSGPEMRAVRCMAATESERSSGWRPFAEGEGGTAWILRPAIDAPCVAARWMEPGDTPTPMVRALAQACALDARKRIAASLQLALAGDLDAPADMLWSRWSGAVIAELPDHGTLLLEPGIVRAAVRPPTPSTVRGGLVALGEAMAQRTLRVQVELDGCDLPLGDLAGVRVGDVLRLRHPVDAPARVRHAAGGVLFDGWLARSRGRRAVELASHTNGQPSLREQQR